MHQGEVVVTVHPEIPTCKGWREILGVAFLIPSAFCRQPLQGMRTVWLVCGTPRSSWEHHKSGYAEQVTSTAVTGCVMCLFWSFNEQEHGAGVEVQGQYPLNLLCMNLPSSPLWFNPYKLWLNLQKFKECSWAKSHGSSAFHIMLACSANAPDQCGPDSVSVLQRSSKTLYASCCKNSCFLQY